MRIRVLKMLAFRKILRMYLMDDPLVYFSEIFAKFFGAAFWKNTFAGVLQTLKIKDTILPDKI